MAALLVPHSTTTLSIEKDKGATLPILYLKGYITNSGTFKGKNPLDRYESYFGGDKDVDYKPIWVPQSSLESIIN